MLDPRTLRERLLRLRARLVRTFVVYGALRAVLVLGLALALVYLLDRYLVLPSGVRLAFLAGLLTAAGYLVWRGVAYPLRKRITAEDLALEVEQRHPELDGRLISTLELDGEALDERHNVSRALVDELRRETEVRLAGVDFDRVIDRKPLVRVGALAGVVAAGLAAFVALSPQLAGIFVRRLLGQEARWPQATRLAVLFPESAAHFTVEYEDARPVRVRLARGASLPVAVHAEGVAPPFVELSTSGPGAHGAVPMMQSAAAEWSGRFRNVRESFTFAPRGGDDDGEGREVEVLVFPAPAIADVRTELAFPAYTGLGGRAEPRGDVEAPVGTKVRVIVEATHPLARATLAFEGGGEVELGRASDPPTAGGETWAGVFEVARSTSYALHLEGENGFSNLEPANFAVVAVADRAPIVKVIEPGPADLDVAPNALVPLRVVADDDYGLAALELQMKPFGADEGHAFDLLAPEHGGTAGAASTQSGAAGAARRLVYLLVDLAATPFPHGGETRTAQHADSFVYRVAAADNRAAGEAGPNRVESGERRVDVVSENELLRVLTERQIRRKEDVTQLRALQEEKVQRLKELLADHEASEGDAAPEAGALAALEVGQNQVSSRALRLTAEFADLFETYLLNRVDRSAGAERLVPLLVERKRASETIDGFDFAVHRPLVEAHRAGAFGNLDVLGRLLEMLGAILDVSETLSPAAAQAVGAARLQVDGRDRPARLREALAAQEEVLRRLDALLERMDEWEDFQEILALFRDLLDDQRDLNAKTKDELRGASGR